MIWGEKSNGEYWILPNFVSVSDVRGFFEEKLQNKENVWETINSLSDLHRNVFP